MGETATIVCPSCRGTLRGGAGFVMRGGGCTVEQLPCFTCRGTGTVPADHDKFGPFAEEFDRERNARDLSLGECARLLGVGVVEVSDARLGRIDPRPLLERLKSARHSEECAQVHDGGCMNEPCEHPCTCGANAKGKL